MIALAFAMALTFSRSHASTTGLGGTNGEIVSVIEAGTEVARIHADGTVDCLPWPEGVPKTAPYYASYKSLCLTNLPKKE